MPAFAGLDVGTTSSKAVVYAEDGATLGAGRTAMRWDAGPQGTQTDAETLWRSALTALCDAAADAGVPVTAVGITSMGESGVLTDAHERPLAPVIAWHDDRDHDEVADLVAELGTEAFGGIAGKPARGQFSLTKHRWLLTHEPAARSAVMRYDVGGWVVRRLGGAPVIELSLAGRTGWLDIAAHDWWDDALAWSGAARGLMPPLVAAGQPVGRITTDEAHPLLRGALLTLAGHDHQASALGARATAPGYELDSSGTAEALVRTVSRVPSRAEAVRLAAAGITTDPSVEPERWTLLGGTEGGLAQNRALEMLGVSGGGLAALDAAAEHAPHGRVVVGGLGTETLTLGGIAGGVGPGEVWKAVVAAAADEALALHRAMDDVVGPASGVIVTGGWRHSAEVMRAKRIRLPGLRVSPLDEAGTLGAATLAARAAGALGPDDHLGPP
ncbi:xylulose kinase [Mycolicibacterium flavescens]|uniref:Xylulose kinase n=1 Tax=Mycolicibacterium flavescens TaxID=1776 RepID=A0A1E3RQS2_MYCFV|nr:FGGY family carbohydrate kinase [Mycolicibacterium flavescens]MCV7279541.1 xylulose kinase [Mycolicibacterium flavescens]ODQ92200.1 xylulose kinase [Mycolicibacterium flavescens]